MIRWLVGIAALLSTLAAAALSTDTTAPDTPEPGSIEAIAKATGDPRFLSPWVSYLPQAHGVPSPLAFFGRIPGTPGEFVDTAKTHAYCRALAAASPRVRVFSIGRSEEGRDILMLTVADEAGIRDLDRLKAATASLADPRTLSAAPAEALIATSRPIYYFNAGLHADETGSAEAVLELAYRLAVSDQPNIRHIRKQLIVLINPVSNPDGRDKMVEWFYRYLKGKTNRATLPRQSPPYWSKYAFVDINRDTHQQTHETTKEWYRPTPPPAEFDWSERDNLNYTETGALAALDFAARNSKEMLRNFYKKGWDSWRKGLDEPPYAYLIPEDQGDRKRVADMVGRLLAQRIEVARAQNAITLKEGNFAAGTYVVRLDQPYRNYAVDLLSPQVF